MNRTRLVAAIGTALVVAALCWVVIWQGGSAAVAQAETRLDEATQRESLLRAQLNAATQFTAGGAASRQELDTLVAALPADADLAEFVAAHDAMATETRVSVDSLTPDSLESEPQPAPPGTTSVGISIQVTGTAASVRAYQAGLEQLARVVAVDEVELSNDGADSVSLRVRLRIFRLP